MNNYSWNPFIRIRVRRKLLSQWMMVFWIGTSRAVVNWFCINFRYSFSDHVRLEQSWSYFQAFFSLRVYFPYIDLITAIVVFSFVIVWSWFMAIIVHMWPPGFIVDYLPEIDCRFPKESATTRNNFPFPFCYTHLFYFELKKIRTTSIYMAV